MEIFDNLDSGGFVMAALFVLGIILYFLIAERAISVFCGGQETRLSGLRREGMIGALIAMAPMLGLLGTVCGIIQTFDALSQSSQSPEVALGIQTALHTTEYGLALAIPAYLIEKIIVRKTQSGHVSGEAQ